MTDATPAQAVIPGVLGAPPPANGATGGEKPATPPAEVKVEAKADAKVETPTPEQLAAKKTADDAKKAADDKAAAEKLAADKKAADDKSWAEFKPKRGEGITTDEATLKGALEGLREAGLTTEQAQKVIALNDKLSA